MKKKALFISFSFLFILVLQTGCENEDYLYHGQIVSLNRGACFNIINISKSVPGGLPVEATIAFTFDSTDVQLSIGDDVIFKIVDYEEFTDTYITLCQPPQYIGQIDFDTK
jgi:hypothetical protein